MKGITLEQKIAYKENAVRKVQTILMKYLGNTGIISDLLVEENVRYKTLSL